MRSRDEGAAGNETQVISNRGLRHLALRVADVDRATEFYRKVFGMRVIWQPDADNAYLTSGCDNLALHRGDPGDPAAQSLDHLGFVVATIDEVESGFLWAQQNGVSIIHPLRHHRDGSVSFYIRDPDGNVIQLLYEPSISPISFANTKA
jgi:catechol 2,3-dioxygenase-like lactoylglutathione lyase family enzyme